MTNKYRFAFIFAHLTIALLSFFQSASGQQAVAATGTPILQTAELDPTRKQELNFVVRVAGSVTGRVFEETAQSNATPLGISGVRVTLRSRDAGFERFKLEQFTDATGTYYFQDLRPGKYVIEIDAGSLPADFSNPNDPN